MYIHIGGEISIPDRFILAIIDLDELDLQDKDSLGFWEAAERAERVEMISAAIPQTMVVCLDKIYLCPLPASSLRKRLVRAKQKILDADKHDFDSPSQRSRPKLR